MHKCPWYEQIPDIRRALAEAAAHIHDDGDLEVLTSIAHDMCTAPGTSPHTACIQWREIAKDQERKLRYLANYNPDAADDIAAVIDLIQPREAKLPIGAARLAITICLALIVIGTLLAKCLL